MSSRQDFPRPREITHVSTAPSATVINSDGDVLQERPTSGDASAPTGGSAQNGNSGHSDNSHTRSNTTTTGTPGDASYRTHDDFNTKINSGTPIESFDIESQTTLVPSPTIYSGAESFHKEQKFSLRATGAVFAVAFFSLELWGRIDILVQEE